jgi:Na+-translocating ferredoxin:NAD+ oxidoreductase RnfC subunit
METLDITHKVREAGVVGAGGAGFPTHVKLNPTQPVDTIIANGAECEPLLQADKAVMRFKAERVLQGLEMAAESVGAKRKVIALKGKYQEVVDAVETALRKFPDIELHKLDNFYPVGDEQVLVEEVTGRVVPEGGIPIEIGVLVDNVITLEWIVDAVENDRPVVSRPICIVGEVENPLVTQLPVGTTLGDAVALAGGSTREDFAVLNGGPMMGEVIDDLDTPIDKRTCGIIVLPRDHNIVQRKKASMDYEFRLSKDICCQCRFCTDLCPRYMLGHDLEPHVGMRSIMYLQAMGAEAAQPNHTQAFICCFCGLCEVYACPLMLSPAKVFKELSKQLSEAGVKNTHRRKDLTPRPFHRVRRVPLMRLIAKLGLNEYRDQPFSTNLEDQVVSRVRIPLQQHVGSPSSPTVSVGDTVQRGDLIATIPDGSLGAMIHASIDGRVSSVDENFVELSRS